jgi:hypothetical protein
MHEAKIFQYRDAKAMYERAMDPLVAGYGDLDAVVDAFSKAVAAIQVAKELKEDGLRQQLRRTREQLDECGGHVEAMDIIDLTRAKHFGLISTKQHDAERARRAADFSVKETPRGVEFGAGAVVGGLMPCGHHGCNVVLDLSKGSAFAASIWGTRNPLAST